MNGHIAIIDLGSQYCGLIARRLRDLGVQSKIFHPWVIPSLLREYSGIILSGGPQSVYEPGAPFIEPGLLELGVPVLGICYSAQLLAQMLGGTVERGASEYGEAKLQVLDRDQDRLFFNTSLRQSVWMSHADTITRLPPGCVILATTERCPNAAFAYPAKNIHCLQFHPEVSTTHWGRQILENFAFAVCKILPEPEASVEEVIAETLEEIREVVQDRSVSFLLSGGVDSTVAFVLCAKALGKERLLGLHVETGLMRRGETAEFLISLTNLGLADRVHIHDASGRVFSALAGIADPEEKRQIVGRVFVQIQSELWGRLRSHFGFSPAIYWLLGQGTIYPDTIESGGQSGLAATIKTHHNRCPEIQELIQQGRVIEPLRNMYKDEVRRIGAALGLPPRLLSKWPFPGPGLAVRVLGQVTAERVAIVQQADEIIEAEIRAAGLYEQLWQAFAVLLPVNSTGVKGDQRSYSEVVAIRAVTSADGMTADWGRLPYDLLAKISTRVCNEVEGISRCVYDVSSKPPATIEWE